jgi:glutaredoxin
MSLAVLVAVVALVPAPQKGKVATCPWCKNDPQLMKAAGVVSHGPMPIGTKTSVEFERELPAAQWIFLESAHIRWASSLPEQKVDLENRERVEKELARLRVALPSVPKEVKKLDPWLRLHLIAMKGEDVYARFQEVLRVTDADFPEERRADGPFMGAGKYLGEKDKFEVTLHSNRATHHLFTKEFSGAQVTNALRWHFPGLHKMHASLPCEDSDLKQDEWLFPHIAHNLSHLFFSAYKHFSYDPPLWLDEGLALCLEKEIDPRATTNEGEEGSFRDATYPQDWFDATRKMLARGRQKTLAQLLYEKEVGALDRDALFTTWSMVRFLLDTQPEGLAKLLGGVKGQLDEQGVPTGRDLPGLQRRLFKEIWGWTPQSFDELWRAWAGQPAGAAK